MELPQSLSHAYLITGGSEDSRKDLARRMASAYLCTGHPVPCGVCRQFLYEFGGDDLEVILAKSEEDYLEMTLGELLPIGFGPANLE